MSQNKLTRWETLVKVVHSGVKATAFIVAAHALVPDATVAYVVGGYIAFQVTLEDWR